MVVLLLGLALWMKADMSQAALCLEEARVTGQATGDCFITLVTMGHLADISVRQGRLRQAAEATNDEYYRLRGWDVATGLPTAANLVAQHFKSRA